MLYVVVGAVAIHVSGRVAVSNSMSLCFSKKRNRVFFIYTETPLPPRKHGVQVIKKNKQKVRFAILLILPVYNQVSLLSVLIPG